MMDPVVLEKLHEVLLEIMDEFIRICKKYNLDYFFIGGTLLGAVRHKGFIPWDDDIDIGMTRDMYEKFLEVCETELDKKYYLLSYKSDRCWLPFVKICKHNTLFREPFFTTTEDKGISIDVFPYDKTIKMFLFRAIQEFILENLKNLIKVKMRIQNGERKSLIKRFAASLFSYRQLQSWRHKLMMIFNKKKRYNYITLWGEGGFRKETFHKDVFFPTVELMFEGKYYHVPNNWHHWLSCYYGDDYMSLPPVEKRWDHEPLQIIFDTDGKENDYSVGE
ncbi:LPS cholinephosphotransferase [Spirochaetia bacterium]|nr:LPS cholinephosphotransferase [Spirochaetia bacterium]